MYHWVKDKNLLKKINFECSRIVNEYKTLINNDNFLKVDIKLVGSGSRNMITQNESEPIDLDYNLSIIEFYKTDNPHKIKEYLRNQLNIVLENNGWDDCQDSTSSFTTGLMHFTKGNKTEFSFDLAVTCKTRYGINRLIRNKSRFGGTDQWTWELMRNSKGHDDKIKWLKNNNLWLEVRENYLNRKNYYLSNNDFSHSSHICYIESVNEVFNSNK